MMIRALLSLAATFAFCQIVPAENWPSWRGPTGMGQSTDAGPPLKWNQKENVRWKAPLPEAGNGSPIVWGDRVFITQATDKGAKRGVMCFDRATGKLLWHKSVDFSGKEPTHNTNPYGSATPATDGSFQASVNLVPGMYRARIVPGNGFAPGVSPVLTVVAALILRLGWDVLRGMGWLPGP